MMLFPVVITAPALSAAAAPTATAAATPSPNPLRDAEALTVLAPRAPARRANASARLAMNALTLDNCSLVATSKLGGT
ncbi:hypothetical protein NLJ89_g4299 [Agrocybe chaxingu]|uniref:Uncharacterized protein n=1 Tax=Agrocybe chaxingu TaxID=84603 RepID=A0A9W8MY30_9AGAR|nr:hypothetical protein NLJ89_g4299 [Agrocybe chaxingu]